MIIVHNVRPTSPGKKKKEEKKGNPVVCFRNASPIHETRVFPISTLGSLPSIIEYRIGEKKKKKKRKTHYFSRKMLLLSREASDFQTVSPFRNPELIFISIARRPRFLFSFPNLVSKLPSLDKPFAYLTNSLNDYQHIPLLFPVPLVSSLDHFSLLPTRLTTRHPT